MGDEPRVAVIDDDEAVLESVTALLARRGMRPTGFASAKAFLAAVQDGLHVDCIVSDIRMPGMSGLALQSALKDAAKIPLIFITGHGDVDLAVRTMKAGAADFIEKPIDSTRLVKAIRRAIEQSQEGQAIAEKISALRTRFDALSDRQKEVMVLAARGLSNKEIALRLALSARTVEHYREWVMEKMQARNVAELVQMAMWLQLVGHD